MDDTVEVNLGDRSYVVHVGVSLLARLGELLMAQDVGRQVFIITDSSVGPLYGAPVESFLRPAGFEVVLETLPAGEGTKSLRFASRLYDLLVQHKADREATVVGLGGGVIGDLAGFVAATFARGIPFVQIPTTLLAMVDASVGGKVAVDHPRGKNMIGAFHQPTMVLCDLWCLDSLPERQFRSGLAEVVKYGVVRDAEFFRYLEENVTVVRSKEPMTIRRLVAQSCRLKAEVVAEDERETSGARAALNYGHTFAHAFETAAGYRDLLHGEAVAMGMICAGRLAERLGMVDRDFTERQLYLWKSLSLPTEVPRALLRHDLVEIMRHDKKARHGSLRFVLPTRMGNVKLIDGIKEQLVREVIEESTANA